MKLIIDISKDRYDEIMSMDWKNCRLIFDEELRAIHDGKALEQEPCDDEYIKVLKKALKYRTAGMVAYNVEWLKNHFDIERVVVCGAQEPCYDCISRQAVIDTIENWLSCDDYNDAERHIMRAMQSVLYDLPPVTPAEKVGQWVKTLKAVMGEGYMWYCDKCEHQVYQDSSRPYPSEKYCPNCGARMQEVEE